MNNSANTHRVSRRRWFYTLALLASLLLVVSCAIGQPGFSKSSQLPYQNASLPVDQRVSDLLGRMTVAEKVGQLAQVHVAKFKTQADYDEVFGAEKVGSVLSGGGELPGNANTPEAWAEGINQIQKAALDRSRLGIPIVYGADATHGLSPVLGAIIFPQESGLGATRDPALARDIAAVTARGAKAIGLRWVFAPVADVSRDIRWGRYYETFSEDPALASSLVAATVEGLQGADPTHPDVAATVKHFIGYSQSAEGRDCNPGTISDSTLKTWFEPPFQAAIDTGAASVMNQHASLNGMPVVASHALLTDLLRGQMGFKGVEISDWADVENLVCQCNGSPNLAANPKPAATAKEAVKLAINAGMDVSMIPDNAAQFTSLLIQLVNSGDVSEARLDEAVSRVLALKFGLGLFEQPYVDAAQAEVGVKGYPLDRSIARRAVREETVLLKNSKKTLPLKKKGAPVLVVGQAATDPTWQMGGWTIGWQGPTPEQTPPAVTILQGIREAIGASKVLTTSSTSLASLRSKAKKARAIIVAIGEKPYSEWLGDNPTGVLTDSQRTLVKNAEATGKPVIIVDIAGRPLMIADLVAKARALLYASLPGTETGHGIADVLFGFYSPRGKLAVSWPARIGDVPMVKGVRLSDGKAAKPLFPYGAGLHY
jgi:beta-glucosidase